MTRIQSSLSPCPISPSPAPSPTQSHNFHTQSLHTDIFYLLRDHLSTAKAFGSLATLTQCNSTFKKIYAPALVGYRIVLRGHESREVFRDIIGADTPCNPTRTLSAPTRTSYITQSALTIRSRFGPYAPSPAPVPAPFSRFFSPLESREPWQVGANPHRQNARLHHRRLRQLAKCENLTLSDFAGAENLIEAIIAAGEEEALFRHIESLCIGSELLWRLAEDTDLTRDIVKHLTERLRPKNVCFSVSIGGKLETMDRLEKIGRMPSATTSLDPWATFYAQEPAKVIQSLCQQWAPESITIHGMTAENIPAVYSARTTIFFGPDLPDPLARVDPLFWRADVRASEIALGVSVLNEGESAVFVGAEDFVGRQGLREEELGRVSLENRVWREVIQAHVREEVRPRVSFVSREEAEKCGCCGKK